jgi:hypothetical protein
MSTPRIVPPGYMVNTLGHLVAEETIKPIDKLRDQTVRAIAAKAIDLNRILRAFKKMAFDDLAAFVEASAEQYDVNLGGTKGHLTLVSFDGQFKIVRSVADVITFDEQLLAAKALVDDYLQHLTEGSESELKSFVNQVFKVNDSGTVRTSEVLRLLRYDIKDPRWETAMQAIRNAINVVGSKSYIRIYQRLGSSDQYMPICLDLAKV